MADRPEADIVDAHGQAGREVRFDWGPEALHQLAPGRGGGRGRRRAAVHHRGVGGGRARRWLAGSASGRELAAWGWDDDVATAAELDAEGVAPVLDGPAFRGVTAAPAEHLR